jgi:TRAP transporter TAXI family solute receptor
MGVLRGWTARFLLSAFVVVSAGFLLARSALSQPAQSAAQTNFDTISARVNANTVAVISGNLNATYISIAYDLSAVLDDGDNLRILPVVGKGGGGNIRDVRFLKGIDLGITQANLLNVFNRNKELGAIDNKIVYIARLFNEEMHVVVRSDSGITSIEQLSGKKVNFSDIGSGTQLSTRDIVRRLGLNVIEVNMAQNDAAVALKKGEIAATILIAGKPTGSTAALKSSEGFRLLPIAYSDALQNDYLPAVLTHDDYPNLIEVGQTVDTLAVGAVLIAYNWPRNTDRYRRIAKFVDAFFPRIADFQKPPRHPKWREVNLAATVPGWKRFAAAEEWLGRNPSPDQSVVRQRFDQFLKQSSNTANGSSKGREQLFEEFLKWNRSKENH